MQEVSKKFSPFSKKTIANRLRPTINLLRHYLSLPPSELRISISSGNRKTGDMVPSISLIPITDCGNCKYCSGHCYDLRNDMMTPSVQNSRAVNSALYRLSPDDYFSQLSIAIRYLNKPCFRYHIGGDIKDRRYLEGMVSTALEFPKVRFLAFTKMYDLVNDYLSTSGSFPPNLQIVFSDWPDENGNSTIGDRNPYNLPTSHVLFADGTTTAHNGAYYCTGNCSNCAFYNEGCWTLKPGEEVVFLSH